MIILKFLTSLITSGLFNQLLQLFIKTPEEKRSDFMKGIRNALEKTKSSDGNTSDIESKINGM